MDRRGFIQQLIYTIVALFFGPQALAELDLVESERFIDEIARKLPERFIEDLTVMPEQQVAMLLHRVVFLWFKNNPSPM